MLQQQIGRTLPSIALQPQAQYTNMAANFKAQPVLEPAVRAQHPPVTGNLSHLPQLPTLELQPSQQLSGQPSPQPSGHSAAAPHGNNEVGSHASERRPARILAIEAVTSSGVSLADATMAVDAVAQAFSQDADPIG